jgi:hypothetical protein
VTFRNCASLGGGGAFITMRAVTFVGCSATGCTATFAGSFAWLEGNLVPRDAEAPTYTPSVTVNETWAITGRCDMGTLLLSQELGEVSQTLHLINGYNASSNWAGTHGSALQVSNQSTSKALLIQYCWFTENRNANVLFLMHYL